MTALSSELAGALTAVCDTLGDTLRTVWFEHDRIVFKLERHEVRIDPSDASWTLLPPEGPPSTDAFSKVTESTFSALNDLAVEVEHWWGEQLVQAVEDTDWTGTGTEASCG